MKILKRLLIVFILLLSAVTWTACSSDYAGTSTVYVGAGYGGYGPGWGYGWGGYYRPPPVVIGPPRPVPY
jgi:hypothetical protein